MSRYYYENFDIVFNREPAEKTYTASVRSSAGDATVTFSLDQAPEVVLEGIARHFKIASSPAEPVTPAAPKPANGASDVGQYLFDEVFQTRMFATYQVSRERASTRRAYLRLRLNFSQVPELVGLPWEMLKSGTDDLAFFVQTSIVRYQDQSFPRDDLQLKEKPVRMLVVISSPAGVPPLQVEEEWARINERLSPHIEAGLIVVERLARATLDELDNRLLNPNLPPVHIFHFIGHGRFEPVSHVGQLLFEDAEAAGTVVTGPAFTAVTGQRLAQSLGNHDSLRLAMLNACEGAMVSDSDSYAGVAQQLLKTGNVPVVVAMRKVITDDLAIAFAQTFYEWLLINNASVDVAMTRSRLKMRDVEQKKIEDQNQNRVPSEWATPIIFIRNHDGYLMNFQDVPIIPSKLTGEVTPELQKDYKTILNSLTKGKLVPFLGLDVNLLGREPISGWQPTTKVLPSYRELVEYLARSSSHPFPYVPALADVSQYALLHSTDEGSFFEKLNSIFTRASEPTVLHQFWATVAAHNAELSGSAGDDLADGDRRFLIVSNTYDGLLEKAFKKVLDQFHVVSYMAHGSNQGKFRHIRYAKVRNEVVPQDPITIEVGDKYDGLYDQLPVILRIPGAVGDSASPRFAITEDQYLDFFYKRELSRILPYQLLTKLRSSSHLFLGHNIREWHLRALLYRIWEGYKPPFISFAVGEPLTDVDKKYWANWNVSIIERDLTIFLNGLRESCANVLPGVQF